MFLAYVLKYIFHIFKYFEITFFCWVFISYWFLL